MAKLNVAGGNVIVKDGKFLLVRETKPSVAGQYNLPAGGIEEGETIFECAIREAKEETGLNIKPENLLGVYQRFKEDGWSIIVFVFLSTVVDGEVCTTEEHPEVAFFSYDEIHELKKKGLLRSSYILPAIDAYHKGEKFPLETVTILKPAINL